MARAESNSVLSDSGLDLDAVAGSAAKVYAGVTGVAADPTAAGWVEFVEHPGWAALAQRAVVMFSEGDDDIALPISAFADMLRRAFARAGGVEAEGEFAALPAAVRFGWEGVARHMYNVCAMDPAEARRLEAHEAQMVAMMLGRLARTP